MNIRATAIAVSLILGTSSVLFAAPNIKDSWHQWRGPNNNGVAESDAPLNFSGTENVKWRIKIPGKGNSTLVIWGDTIYLTTAVPTEPVPEPQARGGQGGRGRGGQGPGGPGGFDPARMLERLPEAQRKQAEELLNGRSPRDLSDEERQKFREIMRSAFGGRGGPGGRGGAAPAGVPALWLTTSSS